MEVADFIIFALALLVVGASPGPSIAALVARVLARGWRDVAPFVSAMWIGELAWLMIALAGLAAIAETFHLTFLILKYCGVAYLIYLAWRMWTAPDAVKAEQVAPESTGPIRMFMTGLAVTLGNPKIMAFYLALLPTIVDIDRIGVGDSLKLAGTTLVIIFMVDTTYIVLAARARALLQSPSSMRLANRLSAAVMGIAAAAIATR